MRAAVLILTLIACSAAPMPVEQAAPPWFELSVSPMIPGATATLEVSRAPDGYPVTFHIGGNATAPICPAGIAPDCLDLGGPEFIQQEVTAADGVARWLFQVPPGAPEGVTVGVQARVSFAGQLFVTDLQEHTVLSADTDLDGDGLTAAEEAALGTDPTNADSDGDTLDDLQELVEGTDPTDADTDGDRMPDGDEVVWGTDPTDPDTDDDRVRDGLEVLYGLDPLSPDTDGDTLEDGDEVFVLRTSPLLADTDTDGCRDDEDPNPTTVDPDSDGDGRADPCDANIPAESWNDMDRPRRLQYMADVVLPTMRDLFVAFDPAYASMDCATCHDDGGVADWVMPNGLHPLDTQFFPLPTTWGSPEEEALSLFMLDEVTVTMAQLLDQPLFDQSAPLAGGFGCFGCHEVGQSSP